MSISHKTDYVAKMKLGDHFYYETQQGSSGIGVLENK
jgi:hypothetical protein